MNREAYSSQMPAFKRGDLVRSRAALPVAHTATGKNHFVADEADPTHYVNQPIPLDSAPVQDLPILAGTVFEIDAVLPWQDSAETTRRRYRLELNDHYFDALKDRDLEITEKEFFGLNTILDEEHTLPMYAFADEETLELVSADDCRVPGENELVAWTADEYFPWSVIVTFPDADQLLQYDIDSFLCDDDSADLDEQGYFFALRPLYVAADTTLLLSVQPGETEGYDIPRLGFFSERLAVLACDVEEAIITIKIMFSIAVDLDKGEWRFV